MLIRASLVPFSKEKPAMKDCLMTSVMKWGYQKESKSTLTHYTIAGHDIYCLWAYNQSYGDILRQWSIDGENTSKTHCHMYRVADGKDRPILFDCSNGLLADPPYDEGSVALTEFLRPLGIDPDPFRDKRGTVLVTRYVLEELLSLTPDSK